MKILIIEDDVNVAKLLVEIIKEEEANVSVSHSGKEGLINTEKLKPNIIYLDIRLPDIDGKDVCFEIKSNQGKYGNPYIIAVTGDPEFSLEKAAKMKFNDVVHKPFHKKDILYKVYKIRERKTEKCKNKLIYKDLIVCLDGFIVTENGKEMKITKDEFNLLKYFVENQGLVLTREKIMDNILGKDYVEGIDRGIDLKISRLKKKSKTFSESISNQRGIGYKLGKDTNMIH